MEWTQNCGGLFMDKMDDMDLIDRMDTISVSRIP